jgi:hypothetical protein
MSDMHREQPDEIISNGGRRRRGASSRIRCGLGGIAGTLCGHCSDAGCNHFDDHCKAAEREVTWTDV